ncbi:MAG: hypothetical protein ACI85V_001363, partial [bacterium]
MNVRIRLLPKGVAIMEKIPLTRGGFDRLDAE